MIHAQDLRRRSRLVRNFRLTGIVVPARLAACANVTFARDPVPTEPSIVEVQRALAAGRFDVRTLERHYETRIKAIDRAGPRLNSVIEINPDVVDPKDVDLLQDLILAAVNEALDRSRELAASELGQLTAGLGLPPGLI